MGISVIWESVSVKPKFYTIDGRTHTGGEQVPNQMVRLLAR